MSSRQTPRVDDDVFAEVTTAPRWLRALGFAAVLLGLGLVLVVFVLAPEGEVSAAAAAAAITVIAVLFVIGAMTMCCRIVLRVDRAGVLIRFAPLWQLRIDAADVGHISTTVLDAVRYGGIGFRLAGARNRALLFSSGAGISISRRSDGRTFFVRSTRPEAFVTAVRLLLDRADE